MDDVRFADGLDAPDRLAFGLGAWQLVTVVAGFALAYAAVRSPLPRPLALPLALTTAVAAAALGWGRLAGRPALDWLRFALRYATAARAGTLAVMVPGGASPAATPAAPPAATALATILPLRPYVLRDLPDAVVPPAATRRTARPGGLRLGARRIVFFSLRGGTGRTMLAVELAALLAGSRGSRAAPARRVALLDLDARGAGAGVRLGVLGTRTVLDYALAPPDERRLIDFTVAHASGARLLLGPARAAGEWPLTGALAREMLRELDLEGFDVVITDVAPQLSQLACAVLTAADDVLVVVTPTPSGVHDAYRTTEALRRIGLRHQLRYVVNRVRPGNDVSEAMQDLNGQVIAEIPDDAAVVDAEHHHALVCARDCIAATALTRLERRVARELQTPCAR